MVHHFLEDTVGCIHWHLGENRLDKEAGPSQRGWLPEGVINCEWFDLGRLFPNSSHVCYLLTHLAGLVWILEGLRQRQLSPSARGSQ